MDIDLIETYLDLMETRSFNRTAERLDMTQSTISHRIKTLEDKLACKLFERSRIGTLPTLAGTRFHEHARALHRQWTDALRQIEVDSSYQRSMRIGLQHDLAPLVAAPALKIIKRQLTETSIYIEVDYSIQMIEDVVSGKLDLALAYSPRYLPDLHFRQLGTVRYVMVSTRPCTIETIKREDYIFPNISPSFSAEHRMLFPDLTHPSLATGQSSTIATLLDGLGGASYISAHSARSLREKGHLHVVTGAPDIHQPVYMAMSVRMRHAQPHNRIIAAFRKVMTATLS